MLKREGDRLTALVTTMPVSGYLLSTSGTGPLTVTGLRGKLGPLARSYGQTGR